MTKTQKIGIALYVAPPIYAYAGYCLGLGAESFALAGCAALCWIMAKGAMMS